jgi:hypothetical protein
VDMDATPSRKRAKVVPCRRPSTSLSAVPEIVHPAADGGGMDSPPQLPTLPQQERTALFRTPAKPARPVFGTIHQPSASASHIHARHEDDGDEDEVMLVGDTPAKPPAAVAVKEAEKISMNETASAKQVERSQANETMTAGPDAESKTAAVVAPPPWPAPAEAEQAAEEHKGADIYAALGWDDDYDGDDLGF